MFITLFQHIHLHKIYQPHTNTHNSQTLSFVYQLCWFFHSFSLRYQYGIRNWRTKKRQTYTMNTHNINVIRYNGHMNENYVEACFKIFFGFHDGNTVFVQYNSSVCSKFNCVLSQFYWHAQRTMRIIRISFSAKSNMPMYLSFKWEWKTTTKKMKKNNKIRVGVYQNAYGFWGSYMNCFFFFFIEKKKNGFVNSVGLSILSLKFYVSTFLIKFYLPPFYCVRPHYIPISSPMDMLRFDHSYCFITITEKTKIVNEMEDEREKEKKTNILLHK